jgi:hypothetical protein
LLLASGGLVQSVANEVVPGVVGAIDVDELVQRIDIEALLDRIDIDGLLARVDLDALLARTELGEIVTRSGSAVASRVLDATRSQAVGVDAFVERWVGRLLRRGDR